MKDNTKSAILIIFLLGIIILGIISFIDKGYSVTSSRWYFFPFSNNTEQNPHYGISGDCFGEDRPFTIDHDLIIHEADGGGIMGSTDGRYVYDIAGKIVCEGFEIWDNDEITKVEEPLEKTDHSSLEDLELTHGSSLSLDPRYIPSSITTINKFITENPLQLISNLDMSYYESCKFENYFDDYVVICKLNEGNYVYWHKDYSR